MESKDLKEFKEHLTKSMILNFEHDGYLAPMVFFFIEGQPVIAPIPFPFLSNHEGKEILAGMIRSFCQSNPVLAAGIIMEAYGARLDADTELSKLILNGDVRVSELSEKQDIIVMLFSTPVGEELITFCVNPETKTVGEEFSGGGMSMLQGVLSNFFTWNRN